jgi:hypothetical protein
MTEQPNTLQLTKSVYARDEVEAMLLFALIKKSPVEECLFWTHELLASGFDMSELIWTIYFDFYFQLNPSLIHTISKRLSKHRKGNNEGIYSLIKTLRIRQSVDNVFTLRHSKVLENLTVTRGRVPAWLLPYDKTVRPFSRAVYNLDWKRIVDYIQNQRLSSLEMVKSMIGALVQQNKIYYLDGKSIDDVVTAWEHNIKMDGVDEYHYTLALLSCLLTDDELIEPSSRIIALTATESEYVAQMDCDQQDGQECPDYVFSDLKLHQARHYPINPDVLVFDLARKKYGSPAKVREEYGENWLWHCKTTPYWQKVFEKYDVVMPTEPNGKFVCENDPEQYKLYKFEEEYSYMFDLDELYMAPLMDCCWHIPTTHDEKDVVDLLDEIYDEKYDNVRFEFAGIGVGVKNLSYVNRNNVFDVSKLQRVLSTI